MHVYQTVVSEPNVRVRWCGRCGAIEVHEFDEAGFQKTAEYYNLHDDRHVCIPAKEA